MHEELIHMNFLHEGLHTRDMLTIVINDGQIGEKKTDIEKEQKKEKVRQSKS